MHRLLFLVFVLSLGACALIDPPGETYVVFFKGSSAVLDESADSVIDSAARLAKRHPEMPVMVESFADTYGSQADITAFTKQRSQAVIDLLVKNGVPPGRIQRRDVGAVAFKLDSQESRRAEITVGNPLAGRR
jgi:outer membrane protein OmpA-like peptidoglycan-associated protein